MIDREKVKKGLDLCLTGEAACEDCPYDAECKEARGIGPSPLRRDALELLKEQQEAVEPEVEILNEIDRIYRCPKCHKAFFYMNQRYCDRCGQKVKWDE